MPSTYQTLLVSLALRPVLLSKYLPLSYRERLVTEINRILRVNALIDIASPMRRRLRGQDTRSYVGEQGTTMIMRAFGKRPSDQADV
jgi:hypothetical protein